MHLLSTLGLSYAVVPEAYLMGNGDDLYSSVTVLTTASTKVVAATEECRRWFREHAPDVDLRIFIIEGLCNISNTADHERFEEALLRVYAQILGQIDVARELDVCLAGGYKTIASSTHQTADLFGCRSLFHLTSPQGQPINSDSDIRRGIQEGLINRVELGSRPGWPTIQFLANEAPQLPSNSVDLRIADTGFRQKILNRLREANQLAQSESELASLPFAQLARWSPSDRGWLEQPLDPATDRDWITQLPKVELHCHLGGFATHGELLDQVRAAAAWPSKLPELKQEGTSPPSGWPEPSQGFGLEPYRNLGDNNGSRLLKDPGCLKKHIELLYEHFQEQNIHYAEVRCSPANYATTERSPWTVLSEILEYFRNCQQQAKEYPETNQCVPLVNLIIIATRQPQGDYRTGISKHLALAAAAADHWTDHQAPRVIGVDLAGYESKDTRAHYFREEFVAAHRAGLGITIHAGENDDSEGIWSAILDLNARRLGHALHLAESPTLLKTVADRRIGIEMCPYANLQIIGFAPITPASEEHVPSRYPLLHYLDHGISVTVNTDNIGISAASLSENFLLLTRLCPGITRLQVLQLLKNAIDQSFLGQQDRQDLLARIRIASI